MTYLFDAISVIILAFILGLTVYQNRTIDELRKRVNDLEKWVIYIDAKIIQIEAERDGKVR